ncbi:hypothetical protein A6V36_18120 [Paraburkholderia ginsengiterrae]|nr:hypothetical protein A6V36_18120 [Paraburkholderia ginsengiterrae]
MVKGDRMSYRLPPLLALRAFEASGRHLSFTKAANELHLTQGAISRQIRLLESFLGHKLFIRLTRKIELTRAGDEYFQAVQQALTIISQATRQTVLDSHRILTLDILPTLATHWLMPRLAGFTECHPGIEVRIVSSIEPADLHSGDTDVAIRVGRLPGARYDRRAPRVDLAMIDNWKGLNIDPLFPDTLIPVVSRKLMDAVGEIATPADLLQYRLINTASRRHAWHDWLAWYGLTAPQDANPLDLGHFFMALQAARDSKGIALVPEVIFANYEWRDELLAPLPAEVPSAGGYYLFTLESTNDDHAVCCLREWILNEAALIAQPSCQSTLV